MDKTKTLSASVIAVVIVICLIATGSAVFAGDPLEIMGVKKPEREMMAPDFTLKQLGGEMKSLHDYKGKVVLLNFFALWCFPCQEEMPFMEKLWQKYQTKDLVIISLVVDMGDPEIVKMFMKKTGISFPVLLDPNGNVLKKYEVGSLPTSYIIGRDGELIGNIVGARKWDSEESMNMFEQLLINKQLKGKPGTKEKPKINSKGSNSH